jgi:hypothetical protein
VTNLGFARSEPECSPKRDNEFWVGTRGAAPVDYDTKRRRRGKDIARVTANGDEQQNCSRAVGPGKGDGAGTSFRASRSADRAIKGRLFGVQFCDELSTDVGEETPINIGSVIVNKTTGEIKSQHRIAALSV